MKQNFSNKNEGLKKFRIPYFHALLCRLLIDLVQILVTNSRFSIDQDYHQPEFLKIHICVRKALSYYYSLESPFIGHCYAIIIGVKIPCT